MLAFAAQLAGIALICLGIGVLFGVAAALLPAGAVLLAAGTIHGDGS